MTIEKKRPRDKQYSLEELNQHFAYTIKRKQNRKHREVQRIRMLALLVLGVLVILVIILTLLKAGTQSTGESNKNKVTDMYNESILSEEEQERWASTDLDGEKIYVVLNTKINLDGSNAYIRLINPIYCTYYYSITIYPEGEEDTILYQAEKVAPGTILEAVRLSSEPSEEQYYAVVKYQIYDEEGNEVGIHTVSVEFITDVT